MTKPRPAIVLVNFNGGNDLIECLDALLRNKESEWRIVIVDNKSTDGSIDSLEVFSNRAPTNQSYNCAIWRRLPPIRHQKPRIVHVEPASTRPFKHISGQIIVIKSRANLGFAAGNNMGLDYVFDRLGCTHAWLLNCDTVPLSGAGQALLDVIAAQPRIGMVGSTLVYYHDPEKVQGIGVSYCLATTIGRQIFNGMVPGSLTKNRLVEKKISYVIGASMMISRQFYRDIGPMNETYFLYFEEMDWAIRARGRYRCGWAPDSVVYHKEGGSIGTSTTKWPSAVSVYYISRGILLFYRCHAPALLPVALARLAFNFVRMAAARKTELCLALLKGAMASIRQSPHRRAL